MKSLISKLFLCISAVTMALALTLALNGCGSSGAAPGATTNGFSMGTVAKSITDASGQQITVNKVAFNTTGATVTLNGDPASSQDVQPGMRVTISGSINGTNGVASKIEIEGELEGMVEQVDIISGSIVLLGQTVLINTQTVFEGASGLAGLSIGQMIEVHGLPDAAGIVEATRVEVKHSPRTQYLSGPISNLDSVNKTFAIRTITVDYSDAKLPAQPLANGMLVKIKGSYTTGALIASSIRLRHVHPDSGHAELEGLVTDYDGTTGTFTLNGQQIQLSSSTSYCHGAASEIANGVEVEVKGEIANGILLARKIEVEGDHGLPVLAPFQPPAIVTPPTPVTPPIATTLPGKIFYDANCSGCHVLGTYDSTGSAPNLSGKGSLISGKITGGHKGISLSTLQTADLAAFVNAN